eukprot:SM000058S18547  [mRNA]  locus=s58:563686:566134:+ [translate_table: standard]
MSPAAAHGSSRGGGGGSSSGAPHTHLHDRGRPGGRSSHGHGSGGGTAKDAHPPNEQNGLRDDQGDDLRGSNGGAAECDSLSNNGSWSGDSEDQQMLAAKRGGAGEAAGGNGRPDKRDKIRAKNEKKHLRQKERRAAELRERCIEYLTSRKLEVLAEQLISMGFTRDTAIAALISNDGHVERSVTWLLEEGEASAAAKEGGRNSMHLPRSQLKIEIADELARMAEMEIQHGYAMLDIERAVVACKGDLDKAAEWLRDKHQRGALNASAAPDAPSASPAGSPVSSAPIANGPLLSSPFQSAQHASRPTTPGQLARDVAPSSHLSLGGAGVLRPPPVLGPSPPAPLLHHHHHRPRGSGGGGPRLPAYPATTMSALPHHPPPGHRHGMAGGGPQTVHQFWTQPSPPLTSVPEVMSAAVRSPSLVQAACSPTATASAAPAGADLWSMGPAGVSLEAVDWSVPSFSTSPKAGSGIWGLSTGFASVSLMDGRHVASSPVTVLEKEQGAASGASYNLWPASSPGGQLAGSSLGHSSSPAPTAGAAADATSSEWTSPFAGKVLFPVPAAVAFSSFRS